MTVNSGNNTPALTGVQRTMKVIGWLFGAAFNLLLIIGVLFIMLDVTGKLPSKQKDAGGAPTSVTESK